MVAGSRAPNPAPPPNPESRLEALRSLRRFLPDGSCQAARTAGLSRRSARRAKAENPQTTGDPRSSIAGSVPNGRFGCR